MKIETFESIEEVDIADSVQADVETQALVEKLGLAGQQKLMVKNTETEVTTRNPYRVMTIEEDFIYRVLCPEVSKVENYHGGVIPLRVLQIISWARDTEAFLRMEIWAATSARVKDPVLVGYTKHPTNTWGEVCYILARWGNELLPLEVLLPDAFNSWFATRKSQLLDTQHKVASELIRLEAIKSMPGVQTISNVYLSGIS